MDKAERIEKLYQQISSSPHVRFFPSLLRGSKEDIVKRHNRLGIAGLVLLAVFIMHYSTLPPAKYRVEQLGIITKTTFHQGHFLVSSKTIIEVGSNSYIAEGPISGAVGKKLTLRTDEQSLVQKLCVEGPTLKCFRVDGMVAP